MVKIVFKELNSEFIKALHNFQKLYKYSATTENKLHVSPKKKHTDITYN